MDVGSILDLNEDTFFYPPQAVFNSTMLPRLPHDLVSDGEINPEAIIVGANQDEGLLDTLNFILDPDLYEVTRNQRSIRGPMSEFGKRFQGNMTDITKQDVDLVCLTCFCMLPRQDNSNVELCRSTSYQQFPLLLVLLHDVSPLA